MRIYSRLCPHSFRCLLSGMLLIFVSSIPMRGLPQEVEGKTEAGRRIELREQAKEKIRAEIRAAHPGWTDSQIDAVIAKARADFNGKSERGLVVHPSGVFADPGASLRAKVLARAAVKDRAAKLLKPEAALGWGYVGYTRGLDPVNIEEVRFSPKSDNPTRAEKFFLLDHSELLVGETPDFTHQHTIEIPFGERLTDEDLTRFYQINNRFLRDVPKAPFRPVKGSPWFPDLHQSNSIVVTGARLPNGREVLTIFSLADLARTGATHGEVYTDLHTAKKVRWGLRRKDGAPDESTGAEEITETGLKEVLTERLSDLRGGRLYYYGDLLKTVNIAELCNGFGSEMVLRSPHVQNDIVETEHRLQQIADRPLAEEQLTIVDGLPQDRQAGESMGALVGDPNAWLDLHETVDQLLIRRRSKRIRTKEKFLQELSEGENDLLIVVAHSKGSELYLNGQRTSLKELQAIPPRPHKPARPRLAVLVSCDAGKPQSENSSSWMRRLLGPEVPSLAQTLIEKKFVTKVLAPDHKIEGD